MSSEPLHIPRNPLLFTWWSTGGYRRLVALCWLAVLAGVVANRYGFYVVSQVVDSATAFSEDGGSISSVWNWVFLLVFVYLVGEVFWRTSGFTAQRWMTESVVAVYDRLFRYLTGHSARYFEDRFAGALTNKISNAANGVLGLLQITTWQFLVLGFGLLGDAFLLYSAAPLFLLILGLWFFVFFFVDLFLVFRLRKLSFQHAEASSSLRGKMVDSATNIATVHQQAREPFEHRYVGKYIVAAQQAHRKSWYTFEWILVANGVMLFLLILLMCSVSISLFDRGEISLGAVVMVITIILHLERSLFFLGEQMSRAMQHYGEIDEGLEELLRPHEIVTSSTAPSLRVSNGKIMVSRVSFSYPEQPVFTDINLEIRAGEKVGLVGSSGAGKSTFVNLLLRQYDLNEGSITIDEQDISTVNLASLRSQIALVPQSTTLFHRTIEENIRYGRLNASREEVEEASQLAQADSFIRELPEGYETYVGERGVKLSGGQRQRISIARAILKDAPILILDEATSALDSESEHAIQTGLEKLMEGRTVIAIAHRLSTLLHMDRILVMEKGKIVEDGTHHELLQHNGRYAKLWSQQVGGFIGET
ncbi:ABC transporter ATP-binding protein/permease [bacterium]|nr:ABC transporter ATP-binding protein/permease [bacterium]